MAEVEDVVSKAASENNAEPKLDNLGRAYSTGKRKDAVARVWIMKGSGKITVNKKLNRNSEEIKLKSLLIENGFYEVINDPFVSEGKENAIEVDNPLDS